MSLDARKTLSCPRCGAPLPPDSMQKAATCLFCGAASAPAPAPAPATVVVITRPAPARSAPSAPRVMDASGLACPRCSQALYEGSVGDVVMHGCGWCGGIWLDNASAHCAVRAFDQATVDLANRASTRAAIDRNVGPPVTCPVCGVGMGRVAATGSLVYIDVCNEHGTWFDRYELGVVLETLRPISHKPSTYSGEIPDFRKGANPELRNAAALVAGGAFALLGGLAAAGSPRT